MVIVRGAFNALLRPGLMKTWDEIAEERTGIYEIKMGQPRKEPLSDRPHAEDEWPPKDWPNWP